MNHLLRNGLATVTVLLGAACGGSSPTAPSATPVPSTTSPGVAPKAIPITLGQTVSGVLRGSDAPQQFVMTISTAGILGVRVTSPGPDWLALQVGQSEWLWGATEVTHTAVVQAGATYLISLGLHDRTDNRQPFELTTSQ